MIKSSIFIFAILLLCGEIYRRMKTEEQANVIGVIIINAKRESRFILAVIPVKTGIQVCFNRHSRENGNDGQKTDSRLHINDILSFIQIFKQLFRFPLH
jgi:hypothetical protein